jgi:hypothetical protein
MLVPPAKFPTGADTPEQLRQAWFGGRRRLLEHGVVLSLGFRLVCHPARQPRPIIGEVRFLATKNNPNSEAMSEKLRGRSKRSRLGNWYFHDCAGQTQ